MELSGQEINDVRAQARKDGNQVLCFTSPKPNRAPKNSLTSGSNSKTSFVRYRECLRNHAANVGGNVFDGCGEFMPGGEEGTIEALKCAACDCHRNFHRREVDGESSQFNASSRRCLIPSLQLPAPLTSATALHHRKYIHANPIQSMINVGFGGGNESSSEDLNVFHTNVEGMVAPPPYVLSKKRFRTKFTQEQRERMVEFAEKIEWRISKQVEEEVDRFCAEAGVKRRVFKVWMHNNKINVKKQTQEPQEDLKESI